jgi:MFS family permease
MLGSLPLTMLPFLLPIQAKQLGATALGIGGLFAAAQGVMVLCRPVIGWGVDRFGRRVFCLTGWVCTPAPWGCLPWQATL